MEEKSSIIIIEGPQGVGKSTMANFLRENLAGTNLYRLTGIKDKSETGLKKNERMYLSLLEYMKSLEEVRVNLVFDRTFFSEQVYCTLGYKDYKFDDVYNNLLKKLDDLDFNIYFVVLYLENTSIYEKRLKREHHNYQAFSLESSVNQQNAYLNLVDTLNTKNIKGIKIAMDDYAKGYEKLIEEIPVLKNNHIKYVE